MILKEAYIAFIEWLATDIIAEHIAKDRMRSVDPYKAEMRIQIIEGKRYLCEEDLPASIKLLEDENRQMSQWFEEHGQCQSCRERGLKAFQEMREDDRRKHAEKT